MHDAASRGHPLQIARADLTGIPHRISVAHGAREQIGHRFDAAMRMQRETRLVIGGIFRLEMIQQQKRIEVIQCMRADAAFEPNAGAFDDRLRLDDFGNFSRCLIHDWTS